MSHRQFGKKISALTLLAVLVVSGVLWYRSSSNIQQEFHDALIALDKGDFETVDRALRKLGQEKGDKPHFHILLGGLMLRDGKFESALRELTLTSRPEGELKEPALLLTGKCLFELGRLAESEWIFQQLVMEQADHPEAHRYLAMIYYDLGANAAAITELETLIQLQPHDFRPHHLLGKMSFDFEQYTEAAKHFRNALDLRPSTTKRPVIVRSLAEALVRERQYQAALEVLGESSEDAVTLALKSECYWSLGQQNAAAKALKHAYSLDPDETSVLCLQARMYLDEGKSEQAIGPLNRILEKDRHNVQARHQLAWTYRALGNIEAYESEMAQMQRSQKLEGQLTILSLEAISKPLDADIRLQIAEICEKLDKQKLAEIWIKAAEECRKGSSFYSQFLSQPTSQDHAAP